MMSGEKNQADNEFWNIVEGNHFYEDVLVPVLADNSLVRHSLRCRKFLASRADEEDCKIELEKLLINYYGLPVEFSESVFDLCEDNLEFNEPCEIWMEPYGQA
jgi:hypothetical protein